VGFRPFVCRLARAHGITGWVLNAEGGVEIHAEGEPDALEAFAGALRSQAPPAARITGFMAEAAAAEGYTEFVIRESEKRDRPTVRVSPDLAVCESCLRELFDPADRRFHYPYINCTDCGPRYTIILGLPYDRPLTTMRAWPMCPDCAREYHDPADRRFHAQPVACPRCGPGYFFEAGGRVVARGQAAIVEAVRRLRRGEVVAVKGIGGYHLACDARNPRAVWALRARKFRKEKPFALMVRELAVARTLVELAPPAEGLLTSVARPIVLAPARVELAGVAPENLDLGVMLAYTPLHHLLFAAGAPEVLVMTSANRSEEPIAYEDDDARARLSGIADGFLIGERPIARRVDDSVVRVGPFGPVILRRARGYAPAAVAELPTDRPILAVGADLKNTVTLVVNGQAFVSQHIGDLDHYAAFKAFQETISDLCRMYEVPPERLLVVHDRHPEYASTGFASSLPGEHLAVQHHRAHIASVLAERGAFELPVVGFAFDGTGYGDDGTVWGGEVFVGSLRAGLRRRAHLLPAVLPGGDAAARFPVQAAAGFLLQLDGLPDLFGPPFRFPAEFRLAGQLARKGVRTFITTSVGRLFDAVAALLGFTRRLTFEGQAAVWLEHLARRSPPVPPYPFPFTGQVLDFRPALAAVVADRRRGRPEAEIARAFHAGLAAAVAATARALAAETGARHVVLSGGVFQNVLLLELIRAGLEGSGLEVWTNRDVPPNDGGVSLGQAALAALAAEAC
jgi:hydrogenase maturation protein HypF